MKFIRKLGRTSFVLTAMFAALSVAIPATASATSHNGVSPMTAMSSHPTVVTGHVPVIRRGIHPDTPNSECQAVNHNLCWTNKNGTLAAGNPISGSAQSGNSNQHWTFFLSSACGDGHVHSSTSCPFEPGSGFNALFNGDEIVNICLTDHTGWCQANHTPSISAAITLQPNGTTGTNWVIDSNSSVAGFVNKSRTDALGNQVRTTTDGTLGHQLNTFVNNLNDADAQWVTLLGV